jgi:hypothetical protein
MAKGDKKVFLTGGSGFIASHSLIVCSSYVKPYLSPGQTLPSPILTKVCRQDMKSAIG